MSTDTYDIYTLSDSTGVRYVGQTKQGYRTRFRAYRSGALRRAQRGHPGRYHPEDDVDERRKWMDGLAVEGRFDEIIPTLIETVPAAQVSERERYWIAHYLAAGCQLVNTMHNTQARRMR